MAFRDQSWNPAPIAFSQEADGPPRIYPCQRRPFQFSMGERVYASLVRFVLEGTARHQPSTNRQPSLLPNTDTSATSALSKSSRGIIETTTRTVRARARERNRHECSKQQQVATMAGIIRERGRRPRSDEQSQTQTGPRMPRPTQQVAAHSILAPPPTRPDRWHQLIWWICGPCSHPQAQAAPPQLGTSRPDGNWFSGPDLARHNLPTG